MGTIKIELDIPEFNNVLDINISLTKDKNGVIQTSIPGPSVKVSSDNNVCESPSAPIPNPFLTESANVTEKKSNSGRKKSSGNMMGSDLF